MASARSDMAGLHARRDCLRWGTLGLGHLGLSQFSGTKSARAAETSRSFGQAKSVIVLWFSGGVPQHETWDPKPFGPQAARGDFGVIASRTPGLWVGELMPQTALHTDKVAVIRTMVTGDNSHSSSGYQMLTGVPHIPLSRENALPEKPNDAPSYAAMIRALRTESTALPPAITIPRRLANVGEKVWPGQGGGVIGPQHDPWLLTCDPNDPSFTVPGCELPEGMNASRFGSRISLLDEIVRQRTSPQTVAESQYDRQAEQALDLLVGGRARQAFELSQEPAAVRDRYGRTPFGQSALLARRLVEAGVSVVHVNWPRLDGKENNGSWDTHIAHSESLKGWLMPLMDQGYSALLGDLADRGLLDQTLVCWVGEFGHTPRINARKGRDHWGSVFSIALAGGGIRGGTVYGETDEQAAYPVTDIVHPNDYLATIFHCLGYHADTVVHDVTGRPLPISRGRVIDIV
ncbi:DUF1501 domain-containing protein [bacterium]|nr:DUF1501 domain-containing protein [bacterium]